MRCASLNVLGGSVSFACLYQATAVARQMPHAHAKYSLCLSWFSRTTIIAHTNWILGRALHWQLFAFFCSHQHRISNLLSISDALAANIRMLLHIYTRTLAKKKRNFPLRLFWQKISLLCNFTGVDLLFCYSGHTIISFARNTVAFSIKCLHGQLSFDQNGSRDL